MTDDCRCPDGYPKIERDETKKRWLRKHTGNCPLHDEEFDTFRQAKAA